MLKVYLELVKRYVVLQQLVTKRLSVQHPQPMADRRMFSQVAWWETVCLRIAVAQLKLLKVGK